MSWRTLAADVIPVLDRHDLAADLGIDADEVPGALAARFAELGGAAEIAEWMAEQWGRFGANRLLRSEGTRPPRHASPTELMLAWLEQRLGPVPRPKARPAALAETLSERSAQHAIRASGYQAVKDLAPEVERLLRYVVHYYQQSLPDTERIDPTPMAMRALLRALEVLGPVAVEPFDPTATEWVEAIEADLVHVLRSINEIRNRVLHGGGTEQDGADFLRLLEQWLDAWAAAGHVPLGAVAVDATQRHGDHSIRLIDERGREVRIYEAPADIHLGATAFVGHRAHERPRCGARLSPVPPGPHWTDPVVGPLPVAVPT